MLGGNQDPFAELTMRREAERRDRADAVAPNRSGGAVNPTLCPACTRPMTHVRTIWRASQVDLRVFECPACNVSVSAKVPPQSK